ncbi:type II secretion system protein GspG [Verrucomicrobiota bacterium]
MSGKRRDERCPRAAGFTLIEVLLVVAILGILAGVIVVNFGGKQKSAMIKATRASISALMTAIDMYEVDTGRYPSGLGNLLSNDGAPNWNGPYVRGGQDVLVDAWGTTFGYAQQGDTSYRITSAGPDLNIGTSDDITSF